MDMNAIVSFAQLRPAGTGVEDADPQETAEWCDALDAVVAYGTPEAIAARMKEHLDAGADHVPVQILTKDENLVSALAELAGPLGLTPA